jgi:hypothetical protein
MLHRFIGAPTLSAHFANFSDRALFKTPGDVGRRFKTPGDVGRRFKINAIKCDKCDEMQ